MSKTDKFLLVVNQGEKIQKWSMFENLTLYVENLESAEKILTLIEVLCETFRKIIWSLSSSFLLWGKVYQDI